MDEKKQPLPAPQDLLRALDCRRWHTLYRPGALADQDAGEHIRMTVLLNVYEAHQASLGKTSVELSEENFNAFAIMVDVEMMRRELAKEKNGKHS